MAQIFPGGVGAAYGGSLPEVALLGVIAIKLAGTELEWNPDKMQFTKNPEANALVNPPARDGWTL